eukprot:1142488-Pelagomonas_calceolata.AAC.14
MHESIWYEDLARTDKKKYLGIEALIAGSVDCQKSSPAHFERGVQSRYMFAHIGTLATGYTLGLYSYVIRIILSADALNDGTLEQTPFSREYVRTYNLGSTDTTCSDWSYRKNDLTCTPT